MKNPFYFKQSFVMQLDQKPTSKLRLFFTILLLVLIIFFFGCEKDKPELPVLGTMTEDFSLYNQDNEKVTADIFKDKVYVTDFFFTTCPSICPIMKRQMMRVYKAFKDHPRVLLFSHTIDPEHDTVEVLRNFADGLGIETSKWQMVTGPQDDIFAMAKHYMLGALKNDDVPGGYIHSGSFVLVDEKKRIRGYYTGTDSEDVDTLIADLKEYLGEK